MKGLERPMPSANELIASREPYFAPVDLETSNIFCGDERPPVEVPEPYIHIFGGALFVPYNLIVIKLVQDPEATLPTFAKETERTVTDLKGKGIQGLGVHSDKNAEGRDDFDADRTDGKVGCGYGELRAAISALIAERGDDILDEAERLFPELFQTPKSRKFGQQVISAHGRLSRQAEVVGKGRDVVQAGIAAGAKVMLVAGDHGAEDGFINEQESTSLKTGEAFRAGSPAYDHDTWASQGLFERLATDIDPQLFKLASLIDIIGTMKALGVKNIVRR